MEIEFSTGREVFYSEIRFNGRRNVTNPEAIMNLDAARERLGGDEELLREMIGFYFEDVPPLLDELKQALAAHDFDAATRAAHSVKGLSGNFDAHRVVESAREMEAAGRREDLSFLSEQFPRLQADVEALLQALHREVG